MRVNLFFQAEDGIRYLVRSRGLGDVYKRQPSHSNPPQNAGKSERERSYVALSTVANLRVVRWACLLYTSDVADERSSVDLGGRRMIKKKTSKE